MNVPFREKKALVAAGIVAVTAVAVVYVVLPLARTWSDWGSQLELKLAQVAQLREQVRGYEALVKKRDVLARRTGSLLGRTPESSAKGAEPRATQTPKDSPGPMDKTKSSERSPDGSPTPKTGEAVSNTPSTAAPVAAMTTGAETEAPKKDKPKDSAADTPAVTPLPASESKPGEPSGNRTPPGSIVVASSGEPSTEDAGQAKTADASSTKVTGAVDSSPTDKAAATKEGQDPNKPSDLSDKAASASSAANKSGGSKPGQDETTAATSAADKAPAVQGSERLAAYFERSASQAGVKIKRVSSKKGGGGTRASKFFTPVTLQLSVEGKAENLVKLLYAVEKGDRFARVQQMDLHRDTAKGNTIEASLDILGYE
ncbi:MAG: hypothetical protein HZB26_11470 [Candidatus Hydrogenedentes bacterium]|nr:hypothetical protein [Candidatus Hydrogenedentota bacterium]